MILHPTEEANDAAQGAYWLYMSCGFWLKGYQYIEGVYVGGGRKREGRKSDPEMNIVFKINCVGLDTYLYVGGGGHDSYPMIP